MRASKNLKTLEKTFEREIREFWTLLGASEAPETWESEAMGFPPASHEQKTARTRGDPGKKPRR